MNALLLSGRPLLHTIQCIPFTAGAVRKMVICMQYSIPLNRVTANIYYSMITDRGTILKAKNSTWSDYDIHPAAYHGQDNDPGVSVVLCMPNYSFVQHLFNIGINKYK